MKSTGIVRKIDQLGRIVIPIELRRALDIKEIQDSLEIFTREDCIVLKKMIIKTSPSGVARKVDQLGRIVLPIELRRKFDIEAEKDSLEIFVGENELYLKKHQPACIFCAEGQGIMVFKGKNICKKCIKEIKKI